jgi:hypothetical protein
MISGEVTDLIHESFVTVNNTIAANNPFIGPLDVSGYKTVRVVLRRGSFSCSACAPVPAPTAFIRSGSRTLDKVVIAEEDLDIGAFATRVFDVPGTQLGLAFKSDSNTASYTVGVSIYGRAN